MTTTDPLHRLALWFAAHCDGDWEHDWRIRLESLDNPGWRVDVNLTDTFRDKLEFTRLRVERSSTDWYSCWLENEVFRGACGTGNLREVVILFLDWVEQFEIETVEGKVAED